MIKMEIKGEVNYANKTNFFFKILLGKPIESKVFLTWKAASNGSWEGFRLFF